jgi:hypothetical protein
VETVGSGNYLSNREWFRDALRGQNVILCYTSALECHQLFLGYLNESQIDVYALDKGEYSNINYHVVESFEGIETVRFDDLVCTSVNQTVNDMLADFDNIDEQSLIEALWYYYVTHNKSFDGLDISPQNMARFGSIKDWAVGYKEE